MRSRAPMAVLAALLCLGCPETRAQRGRDALRLVVRMHREIYLAETRQARAFQQRPEATQARGLAFWPRSRVADAEGLRVSRDLLDAYMGLAQGGRDEDRVERVRCYLAWRIARDRRELEALDQASRSDPAPLDVLVRQGDHAICAEELAITRRYAALAGVAGS